MSAATWNSPWPGLAMTKRDPHNCSCVLDSLNFEAGKKNKKTHAKTVPRDRRDSRTHACSTSGGAICPTSEYEYADKDQRSMGRNHQMSNKFQNSGLLTALWSNAGNLWIPMRYCRHFWHHHCVCLICQKNCDITSTWPKKNNHERILSGNTLAINSDGSGGFVWIFQLFARTSAAETISAATWNSPWPGLAMTKRDPHNCSCV